MGEQFQSRMGINVQEKTDVQGLSIWMVSTDDRDVQGRNPSKFPGMARCLSKKFARPTRIMLWLDS